MSQDEHSDNHSSGLKWNWRAIGSFAAAGGILARYLAGQPGYNQEVINRAVVICIFIWNAYFWFQILATRINEGYPREYVENRKRGRINTLKWLGGIGGLAVLLMAYGLVKKDDHFENYAFLLELGLAVASVISFSVYRDNSAKITLYFEKPVPGEMTGSGLVARYCTALDELATELGVKPLSEFGFADDWPETKLTVTYHRPELGLETLAALQANLENSPSLSEVSSRLEDELGSLQTRLREAVESDARFCFILHNGAKNAMEIEQRKGFF